MILFVLISVYSTSYYYFSHLEFSRRHLDSKRGFVFYAIDFIEKALSWAAFSRRSHLARQKLPPVKWFLWARFYISFCGFLLIKDWITLAPHCLLEVLSRSPPWTSLKPPGLALVSIETRWRSSFHPHVYPHANFNELIMASSSTISISMPFSLYA